MVHEAHWRTRISRSQAWRNNATDAVGLFAGDGEGYAAEEVALGRFVSPSCAAWGPIQEKRAKLFAQHSSASGGVCLATPALAAAQRTCPVGCHSSLLQGATFTDFVDLQERVALT